MPFTHGCHVWAGPDLEDLALAARLRADAPEVWAPSAHPHLALIADLWPNATLRTIGPAPAALPRPYVIHTLAEPHRLERHTLDRPRHTVICPWPPARLACPPESAHNPAAQTSPAAPATALSSTGTATASAATTPA